MTVTPLTHEDWFAGRRGKSLLQTEQKILTEFLSTYTGNRALFLGSKAVLTDLAIHSCRGDVWQGYSRISRQGSEEYSGDLVFNSRDWPFQDESLDLVVLSHGLTQMSALQSLAEAWRVLAPEGQLVISVMQTSKCPLSISTESLVQAMTMVPVSALSDRYYCGRLGLDWAAKAPQVINKFCPLRIIQWQKHKPGMIGRVKFSLPRSGSAWEYT